MRREVCRSVCGAGGVDAVWMQWECNLEGRAECVGGGRNDEGLEVDVVELLCGLREEVRERGAGRELGEEGEARDRLGRPVRRPDRRALRSGSEDEPARPVECPSVRDAGQARPCVPLLLRLLGPGGGDRVDDGVRRVGHGLHRAALEARARPDVARRGEHAVHPQDVVGRELQTAVRVGDAHLRRGVLGGRRSESAAAEDALMVRRYDGGGGGVRTVCE